MQGCRFLRGHGRRRLLDDRSGQALVEMTLVMAMLLMLLLGIFELGRITHAYLTVAHASREGARVAAVGRSDDEIWEAVQRAAAGLEPLSVRITPAETQRRRGDPVTVQIETSVDLIVPIVQEMMPDPFPVSGTTVMRME